MTRAKKNTITVTVKEMKELFPAFKMFSMIPFRGKMLYQITKLFGKVESEMKAYNKTLTDIIKRLGALVDADQLLEDAETELGRELSQREEDDIRRNARESWKVTTENDDAFKEEHDSILDQEVDLTGVLRISWKEIQELPKAVPVGDNATPAILSQLAPIMDE